MTDRVSDNTPVLIGGAQRVIRELKSAEDVRSPVDLAADALRDALEDTQSPHIGPAIDTLVTLRTFIDFLLAVQTITPAPLPSKRSKQTSQKKRTHLKIKRFQFGVK